MIRHVMSDAGTGGAATRPTIAVALAQFLAEQERCRSPRTVTQYRDVVELLQHYLNDYAFVPPDDPDAERDEQLRGAAGGIPREFCTTFGPERIMPHVGEFLGYFMVRKVMASRTLLRASGTVTKRLAAWLAERGYVDAESAEWAKERGAEAARELPKADELATRLRAFAEAWAAREAVDEIEDHFQITRVEPGKVWLAGLIDGRERGPLQLPEESCRLCQVGWRISGVIGRIGRRWQILDAWNVYPL
jgi:hypothetical protein